jgi:hypothetical protein
VSQTPILKLNILDIGGHEIRSFADRVDLENQLSASMVELDLAAGLMTGSYSTTLNVSGTLSTVAGQFIGAHYAPTDRVIKEVVAFARLSGSGGVTQVDLQLSDSGGVFNSIYSNAVFQANVSGGAGGTGNYGLAKAQTMRSSSWPAGTVLRAQLLTAAALQSDLTVVVVWKPSGSYGA